MLEEDGCMMAQQSVDTFSGSSFKGFFSLDSAVNCLKAAGIMGDDNNVFYYSEENPGPLEMFCARDVPCLQEDEINVMTRNDCDKTEKSRRITYDDENKESDEITKVKSRMKSYENMCKVCSKVYEDSNMFLCEKCRCWVHYRCSKSTLLIYWKIVISIVFFYVKFAHMRNMDLYQTKRIIMINAMHQTRPPICMMKIHLPVSMKLKG